MKQISIYNNRLNISVFYIMMTKRNITIISVIILTILLYGCTNKIKTYSFDSLLCEKVEDEEHNRNINLLKINVDSDLQDQINESISSKFIDEYNSYMKKAPYEFQYKTIDTTYTEKDNILYIAVASNLPSQYVAPYITECVYYDLVMDKCYSFDELLEKIDIEKVTLQAKAAEMIHKNVGKSYTCSLAGLFYDKTGNMLIIINTEDTNPEGVGTSETLFYDYINKKLLMTGDFSGFDSIK